MSTGEPYPNYIHNNINTVATIPTDGEPVYSKLYPYPKGVSDFVNAEVNQLLAHVIIRPSKSPYNNPIWVVDKKSIDDAGHKQKRLVIDFRKLNHKTTDDKYSIPSISTILSNLYLSISLRWTSSQDFIRSNWLKETGKRQQREVRILYTPLRAEKCPKYFSTTHRWCASRTNW